MVWLFFFGILDGNSSWKIITSLTCWIYTSSWHLAFFTEASTKKLFCCSCEIPLTTRWSRGGTSVPGPKHQLPTPLTGRSFCCTSSKSLPGSQCAKFSKSKASYVQSSTVKVPKSPPNVNLHFGRGGRHKSQKSDLFNLFKIPTTENKTLTFFNSLICGNIWPHIFFPPPSLEEIATPLSFPHDSTAQRVMLWDVEARVVRLSDSSCYYRKTAVPHHDR